MAIDLSRVAAKALETALDDGSSRRKNHMMRNVAAGAALAVGARAAVAKTPGKLSMLKHLPDIAKLRDVPDRVRDRMADAGWLDDEAGVDELEPEDEFDLEEPVDEEEPDDEEELDDEEDLEEEPEAEADEDYDEDEDDEFEDEDEPEDAEDEESEAPELEIESEDDEDLHPEDRPPKPPRSKAKSGR